MFERLAFRQAVEFSVTTTEARRSKKMSANTEFYTQQNYLLRKVK